MCKKILLCGLLVGSGSSKVLDGMDPNVPVRVVRNSQKKTTPDELVDKIDSVRLNPTSIQERLNSLTQEVNDLRNQLNSASRIPQNVADLNKKMNNMEAMLIGLGRQVNPAHTEGTSESCLEVNRVFAANIIVRIDKNYKKVFLNEEISLLRKDIDKLSEQLTTNSNTVVYNTGSNDRSAPAGAGRNSKETKDALVESVELLKTDLQNLKQAIESTDSISRRSTDGVFQNSVAIDQQSSDRVKKIQQKLFGYTTAVLALSSGVQAIRLAQPFVGIALMPLIAHFKTVPFIAPTMSLVEGVGGTVSSIVGCGYALPAIVLCFLAKSVYDNRIDKTIGWKKSLGNNLILLVQGIIPALFTGVVLVTAGVVAAHKK